MPSSGFSS